jgi:hypothetical protein
MCPTGNRSEKDNSQFINQIGVCENNQCLQKLILFGEKSLQRVVSNYLEHYQERNHQGKDNLLLFPVSVGEASSRGAISCRERLGGLLKYYSRTA